MGDTIELRRHPSNLRGSVPDDIADAAIISGRIERNYLSRGRVTAQTESYRSMSLPLREIFQHRASARVTRCERMSCPLTDGVPTLSVFASSVEYLRAVRRLLVSPERCIFRDISSAIADPRQ